MRTLRSGKTKLDSLVLKNGKISERRSMTSSPEEGYTGPVFTDSILATEGSRVEFVFPWVVQETQWKLCRKVDASKGKISSKICKQEGAERSDVLSIATPIPCKRKLWEH